jgi:hypothetical protein
MRRKRFIHDLSQLFAITEHAPDPDSHAGDRPFAYADSNPYRQQYRA